MPMPSEKAVLQIKCGDLDEKSSAECRMCPKGCFLLWNKGIAALLDASSGV